MQVECIRNRDRGISAELEASGTMVYQYKIKQLVKRDVIFLNSLLLDYADLFFGYANADKVRTNNKMKCNKV